jgi:hypothetical protein
VPFFQNLKEPNDHFIVKIELGGQATSRLLFLETEDHTVYKAQLPSFFGNITDVYKHRLVKLEKEAFFSTALVPASAEVSPFLQATKALTESRGIAYSVFRPRH